MKKYFAIVFMMMALVLILPTLVGAENVSTSPSGSAAVSPNTSAQNLMISSQQQLSQLLEQINKLQAELSRLQGEVKKVGEQIEKLTKSLKIGAEGKEVEILQNFLKQDPAIYPEGKVTGYYGPLTEKAVKKFQQKNGIESVGAVGPITMTRINESIEKKEDSKITICHVPNGNTNNKQTITINKSALEVHLAHGDTINTCVSTQPIPPIACTTDAKLCSNGSYVSRTGPNCEFAACPTTPTPTPIIPPAPTPTVCAPINVSLSPATPQLQNASPGQNGVLLVIFNIVANCNLNLNSFAVSLLPMPNGYQNISALRLYDDASGVQLGTTQNVTGASVNFASINTPLTANQVLVLKVAGDVSPSAVNGSTVYGVFGGSSAVNSSGGMVGNNASGNIIMGNTMTVATIIPIQDSTSVTGTNPRIMYWWGKVNQHTDANGNWLTDPDGVSGADLDKLTYCKKFYPNTIGAEDYMLETTSTWLNRGNIDGPFTSTKMSTKCLQPSVSTIQTNNQMANALVAMREILNQLQELLKNR